MPYQKHFNIIGNYINQVQITVDTLHGKNIILAIISTFYQQQVKYRRPRYIFVHFV